MRIVENNRQISKNNGHFFLEILKRIMGKNWGIMGSCLREEVSAARAVNRTNERTNDKTTTVTLRPRVNE